VEYLTEGYANYYYKQVSHETELKDGCWVLQTRDRRRAERRRSCDDRSSADAQNLTQLTHENKTEISLPNPSTIFYRRHARVDSNSYAKRQVGIRVSRWAMSIDVGARSQ
jgi:hypothetical protein